MTGSVLCAGLWLAAASAPLRAADAQGTAPAPNTLPTQGKVVSGQAAITQSGTTLTVTQGSARTAIDWQSFNIGSGATVDFVQPGSHSVALNQVLTGNPSQIFGTLHANGSVYLSNAAGVYFAPSATVSVGSLLATTHGIALDDFMAGRDVFNRDGATAQVINAGHLTATSARGFIALLAPEVRNEGLIVAQAGTVALAAGERITLNFDPADNLTSITVTPSQIASLVQNRTAILTHGGQVILSARAAIALTASVVNTGSISADSAVERGGVISIEASSITLGANSSLSANGATGGGTVQVGGAWQGGAGLVQADAVTMDATASISANATQSGNGGTVVVRADAATAGTTAQVHGSLTAQGGPHGGDGGRIETSAYTLDTTGARVSAAAPQGSAGLWLLDPADSVINQTVANTYGTSLSGGTSVMDQVSGTITADGVLFPITITDTGAAQVTLTLQGTGGISLNNTQITSTSGKLNTVLWANGTSAQSLGAIYVAGSTITTRGGDLWMGGGTGSSFFDGIAVGNGAAVTTSTNSSASGVYVYGSTLTTAGGNIFMNGTVGYTGTANGGNAGVQISGTAVSSAAGNITLIGDAGASAGTTAGVWLGYPLNLLGLDLGATSLSSTTGNISLTGTTENSGTTWSHGVGMATAANGLNITSTGGNITFNGTAAGTNAAEADSAGVMMQVNLLAPPIVVDSSTGQISLQGYDTSAGAANVLNNALRFTPGSAAGNIQIGSSTDAGNILFQGNSMGLDTGSLSTTGTAGSLVVKGTGALSVLPTSSSFSRSLALAPALSDGVYVTTALTSVWSLGNSFSSVQFGTPGNTADITVGTNFGSTGNMSLYGGTLTLGSGVTVTKGGGSNANLLMQGINRVLVSGATLSSTSNKLNLLLWADSNGTGSYGVDAVGSTLTTNGGDLWIGGGAGSSTFDGLTVGNGAAGGSGATNFNGISLSGAVSTGGGNVYLAGATQQPAANGNGTSLGYGGNLTLTLGSGNFTLISDRPNFNGQYGGTGTAYTTTLSSTGTVTLQPLTTAFDASTIGSTLTWSGTSSAGNFSPTSSSLSGWTLNGFANLTGLTLGKAGMSTGITVGSAISIAGPISLFGNALAVNAALTSTNASSANSLITLGGSGAVTQTAALTASNLLLNGSGSYTLGNSSNAVGTLAATGVGNLNFTDGSALTIGTVGASSGIALDTGTIKVNTVSGNLTVAGSIATTNAADTWSSNPASLLSAVTLNAGSGSAAGTATGGDLIWSSGAISMGSGGLATLYTGGVTNSTAAATMVGAGTNRFRYDSNASTSNYTTALGSGTYLIYRQQPTVSALVTNDVAVTYGTAPTLTNANVGVVNGDATQVISSPLFSTSGNYRVGTYTIADTSAAMLAALGYATAGATISNGTLTVSPLTLNVTGVSATNRTYNGTTVDALSGGSISPLSGDLVALVTTGASGSFGTKDVGTAKSVTASGYTLNGTDSSNYWVAAPTGLSANVTAAALTLSTSNVSKVYDGTTSATGTAVVSSGSLFGADSLSGGSFAYANKDVGTGNRTVTVSGVTVNDGAAGADYSVGYASNTTSTITSAPLTLTTAAVTKTYDGTLTVTGGAPIVTVGTLFAGDTLSGGSFTYTNKDAGTANKTVTVSGVTINDGAGGADYTVSYLNSTTSTITPAALTISTAPVTKSYDGTTAVTGGAPVLTAGVLFGSDSMSGGNYLYDDPHAGMGKTVFVGGVTVSDGNGGDNYILSYQSNTGSVITPASLTVTAPLVGKTYDGTTGAPGAPVVGALAGAAAGDVVATGALLAYTDPNAGTSKTVNASGLIIHNSSNVNVTADYAITYLPNTASVITPAALSISTGAVTKTYDGTTAAFGAAPIAVGGTQLFGTDTLSGGTFVYASKNVGAGNRVVSAAGVTVNDGVGGANYDVSYLSNITSTITPAALTLGTAALTKTYDATTDAPGAQAIVTAGTLFSGDTLSGGSFAYLNPNAGTGKTVTVGGVSVSDGNGGNNYAISYQNNTASAITPAPLVLSTANVAKSYDSTTAVIGGAAVPVAGTQLFGSDSLTGGTFLYTDPNAGSGNKTVSVAGVAVSDGNGGNNYAVTYQSNTTSTISPAALVLSTGAVTKPYDGTTGVSGGAAIAVAGTQLFGSDTVSGGMFAYADRNAGAGNKVVTVTGVTVNDGEGGGNYGVSYLNNTASTITPAAVTVGISPITRTYDGTTVAQATPMAVNGTQLFNGDTLSGGAFSFDTPNVGSGKSVILSGVTVNDGNGGNNYVVSYQNNAASTITPASLVVSAPQVTKTYDGTLLASGNATVGTLAGGAAGDAVSTAAALTFIDPNAGTGKTVNVSGLTIDNASHADVTANYAITYVPNTASVIDPAALAVTALDASKVVTTTDPTGYQGVRYSGFVNGETVGVLAGTAVVTRTNPGSNAAATYSGVLMPSGLSSPNYAISYVPGSFTITPADQLLVSVSSTSIQYGSTQTYGAGDVIAQYLVGGSVIHTLTESSAGNNTFTFTDGVGGALTLSLAPNNLSTSTSGNVPVGSYALVGNTLSATGADFSGAPQVSGTLAVTAKPLSASATGGISKVYDSTTGMNAVTLALAGEVTGDAVTVSGSGAFSQANVGTHLGFTMSGLQLSGPDAANYSMSGGSSFTGSNGTITPAPLILSTASVSKTYDGTTAVVGGTLVAVGGTQLFGSDTLSGGSFAYTDRSVGGANKTVNVGGATVNDGDGGADYTVSYTNNTTSTITPATLLVGTDAITKTYDATNTAMGAAPVALSGTLFGGDTLSGGSFAYTNPNAGSGKTVTVSAVTINDGNGGGNYVISYQDNTASSITPAGLIVTANDSGKVVTTTDPSGFGGAIYSGFVNGEGPGALGGSLSISRTNSAVNTPGNYAGVLAPSGLSSGNYAISYVNGGFSITPASGLLISVAPTASTYGSAPAFGLGDIAAQYLDAGHNVVSTLSGSSNGGNSFTFTDAVGGSVTLLLDATGAVSGSGNLAVGSHPIAGSVQGTIGNDFTGVPAVAGALSVAPKLLTAATAGSLSKQYDGTTGGGPVPVQLGGLIAGDAVSAAGTGTFAQDNAGTGLDYLVASIRLTGADAGDYILCACVVRGANGTITPRPLSVTGAIAQDKVFDGTSVGSILSASLSGVIGSDAVSLLNADSGSFSSPDIGTHRPVTPDFVLGGAAAANYTLSLPTLFADITPAIPAGDITVPPPARHPITSPREDAAGDSTEMLVLPQTPMLGPVADPGAFGSNPLQLDGPSNAGPPTQLLNVEIRSSGAVPSGSGSLALMPVESGVDLLAWLPDTGMPAGGFISVTEMQPLSLRAGVPFSFQLPPDTFVHSDPAAALRFSARVAGGGALPAWIQFDAVRLRFAGTSPPGVQQLDVIVYAFDKDNHRAQTDVILDFR